TRATTTIKETKWTYGQHAIVCVIDHERDHGNIAFEHFLPSGPFAVLPMQGLSSSIVWTEREAVAQTFLNLSDEDFNLELMKRFGSFLGQLRVRGKRWSYPLNALIVHDYIDHRLAL